MSKSIGCIRVVLVLCLLFGLSLTRESSAQAVEIRFPTQPVAGRPVVLEMLQVFWTCGSFWFTSPLYDVTISGQQIHATVDTEWHAGDWGGTCPGDLFEEWRAFELDPLQAGEYELFIDHVHVSNQGPSSGPELYATAVFTVAAAPQPAKTYVVPSLSTWSLLLLAGLSSLSGWHALRQTG